MTSLMACPECALVQRVPGLPAGGAVECARCGAVLARRARGGGKRGLALTLAAAICCLVASVAPVVTLESGGGGTPATIGGTAAFLWSQHQPSLAALVLVTAVVMPGLEIGLHLFLFVSRRRAALRLAAARWLHRVRRWSMADVLVLA
ncbi:MAG TPA: paraquat-inducible protein A, partial [Polyangia bacterium]|nr:paraquat-inducible protein A [Polyangia bacterium]